MSLVLAVQPDSDQASRLAAVCRRVGTELVVAPTAQEAIGALGDRVPDLILSAPLLSATDEAAIGTHLRQLGNAALHVQALTAPVLGDSAVEPPAPRGLFASFIKPRRETAVPAACDPGVFAEQISSYLLRAVAERTALTGAPIQAPPPEPEAQSFAMSGLAPQSLDQFEDTSFDFASDGSFEDSREDAIRHVDSTGETFDAALEVLDDRGPGESLPPDESLDVLQDPLADYLMDETLEPAPLETVADAAGDQLLALEELLDDTTSDIPSFIADAMGSGPPPFIEEAIASGLVDETPDTIDLSRFVEELTSDSRPPRKHRDRQRKRSTPRRRTQPVYQEDAYFDPDRVAFAALVATFDEFTQNA